MLGLNFWQGSPGRPTFELNIIHLVYIVVIMLIQLTSVSTKLHLNQTESNQKLDSVAINLSYENGKSFSSEGLDLIKNFILIKLGMKEKPIIKNSIGKIIRKRNKRSLRLDDADENQEEIITFAEKGSKS